jgi:hypothetical protein
VERCQRQLASFADATCYSVVPVVRKTISSFAIAMVWVEGGSHSATDGSSRATISPSWFGGDGGSGGLR